jgi:hypothetical protein
MMENMKYKVGDKVILTNGDTMTVYQINDTLKWYFMKEDPLNCYTDEMIEGLVEEETKNWADTNIPDGPYTVTYDSPSMNDSMNKNNIHNEIILPKGYIFKDENGNEINTQKIVLEKKKKEYPKTYEECYQITELSKTSDIYGYKNGLLFEFQKLLIARDAYWKIAGEEMGLGKSWENSRYEVVYGICRDEGIIVKRDDYWGDTHVFEFPIREMRDAFYENFKKEIEICKELL